MAQAKKASKKKKKKSKASRRKKATEDRVLSTSTYANREIQVRPSPSGSRISIDGKNLPCDRDDDTGAYFSNELPYLRFGSLEELARAAIDSDDTPY